MLILVTNDDGIHAPGLRALATALAELGTVVVAAPDRERSAVSHSLTLHQPLRMQEVEKGRFSVEGTPTDCIHLASQVILRKKPDLLASGINRGANLGDDVTYSGTVWSALEGSLMGIPSFAVSLADGAEGDFAPAARFAVKAASWIRDRGLPPGTILNINVPAGSNQDLSLVRVTRQGHRRFLESVVEKKDPRGKTYFWIAGEYLDSGEDPETDVGAVARGYVSITPLHADMTCHREMEALKEWDQGR